VTGGANALQPGSAPQPAGQPPATPQPPPAPPQTGAQPTPPQQAPAQPPAAQTTAPQPQAPQPQAPQPQPAQTPAPQTQPPPQGSTPAPAPSTPPSSTPAPAPTQAPPQNQPAPAQTGSAPATPRPVPQEATVTRILTDGTVTVRTAAGEATIQINPKQIPAFLRAGAVVALTARQTGEGLQALLQPRSALRADAAGSAAQTTASSGAAQAQGTAARALPPLTDGQVARATVLRATSLPQGIASGPLPSAGGGLSPQQAAQAAARYLLASSPQLKPSAPFPAAAAQPSVQSAAPLPAATPPAPAAGPQTGQTPAAGSAQGTPASGMSPSAPGSPPQAASATGTAQAPVTQAPPATGGGANPASAATTNTPPQTAQTGTPATSAPVTARNVSTPAGSGQPAQNQTAAPAQAAPASPSTAQGGTPDPRPVSGTGTAAPSSANPAGGAQSAPASAPRPAAALPPGTDFPVRVLSVGQPAGNALGTQTGSGGTVISGTIVATGGNGQAIVSSSLGLLDVAARAESSQLQAEIRMEMLSRAAAESAGRSGTAPQTPLSVLSREWPALEESLRALEIAAPQGAAQLAATIARPGPQLTATMLFFLAAVRGGSLGNWLGKDASQSLESSNKRLLSALTGDFQTLNRASEGGPESGGWRAFFMPMQNNETLEQLRLFILPAPFQPRDDRDAHDDVEEREESAENGETRFIVDLLLSGLGPFQIDGSVAKKSLSLLIRTRHALPSAMRADIIDIFETTAARTGMEGAVSFKVQKEFPPLPLAELMPGGPQGPDVYA